MRLILIILIFCLESNLIIDRDLGETEITAEEGIEVFQDEKYYHLKKNVKIDSDNFILTGDDIKIFFEDDLYDLQIINASGSVKLNSFEYNLKGSGEKLNFVLKNEEIHIQGLNSNLFTENVKMYSDGEIKVVNLRKIYV